MITKSITDFSAEIIHHLFSFLPADDADNFAVTCQLLSTYYWDIYPSQIRWHRVNPTVYLLREIIELNDALKQAWLQDPATAHRRLLDVACSIEPISRESFRCDPSSAWKVAVLGGFYHLAKHYLGADIKSYRDSQFRGVLAYLAASGATQSLKNFIEVHYPEGFSIAEEDPSYELAKMAAIKGCTRTLIYLRDELGYDLTVVRDISDNSQESLLTYAVQGGSVKMVDFLLQEGVPMTEQQKLPLVATHWNRWHLFNKLDPDTKSYSDEQQLRIIAGDASTHGHSALVKNAFIDQYGIKPMHQNLHVVFGGHSEIFWDFVAESWISIDDWLSSCYTPLSHIFALQGFLYLITQLIRHNAANVHLEYVDFDGRTILHKAAEGDQWFVYCEMKKLLAKENKKSEGNKNNLLVDKCGYNVAHVAAKACSVNFLKHLSKEEPDLLQQLTYDGDTVLHCAANSQDISGDLLLMLMDFGVDPLVKNDRGQTVVDTLLSFEEDKEFFHAIADAINSKIEIKNSPRL
ncbi:MAG: hypothetical protein KDH94_05245 [Coxiellaceae bacterium]|nr:hypothetical protein [Coxiellaceae bacterium]